MLKIKYLEIIVLRQYCNIWNQHPQIRLNTKFREKTKAPKFGTKMPYLGISGLEFENNTVIFEINTLGFVYLQNFVKKWKCLNLGPKLSDMGSTTISVNSAISKHQKGVAAIRKTPPPPSGPMPVKKTRPVTYSWWQIWEDSPRPDYFSKKKKRE